MKLVKSLLPVCLGLLLLLILPGCTGGSKAQIKTVIHQELDLLKNLDSDTTQKYVSYTDLFPDEPENATLSPEIQEVFSLFFQDFDYKILNIEIAGRSKTATASVRLITLDARTLASDYAAALLQFEILQASDSDDQNTEDISPTLEDRYLILNNLLKSNAYEDIQTDCTIELNRSSDNKTWEIKRTRSLENDLVGGLITHLSNNNLLSPEDTLSVYLDTLKSMDLRQMTNFLGIESLLNTTDTDKAKIATALVEQVHQTFNYQITDIEKESYTARVDVEITTFDSDAILEDYQEKLNVYLETLDAVIDGSEVRHAKSYDMLLDCIKNSTVVKTATASFELINDGVSWKLLDDGQVLGNAIFGTLSVSPVTDEE